jgi:hypothetical protein
MQVFTSQPAKQELLLFSLAAANMNSTADQALTKLLGFTNFLITRVRVAGSTGNLTTAAGGIYSAAAKGGNAIVAAAQVYARSPDRTLGMELTLAAVGLAVQTTSPILSLTTGQGSAMTADFYVFGVPLT